MINSFIRHKAEEKIEKERLYGFTSVLHFRCYDVSNSARSHVQNTTCRITYVLTSKMQNRCKTI